MSSWGRKRKTPLRTRTIAASETVKRGLSAGSLAFLKSRRNEAPARIQSMRLVKRIIIVQHSLRMATSPIVSVVPRGGR
jgi:hypothetical protein